VRGHSERPCSMPAPAWCCPVKRLKRSALPGSLLKRRLPRLPDAVREGCSGCVYLSDIYLQLRGRRRLQRGESWAARSLDLVYSPPEGVSAADIAAWVCLRGVLRVCWGLFLAVWNGDGCAVYRQ
jgi:hypothetical protein